MASGFPTRRATPGSITSATGPTEPRRRPNRFSPEWACPRGRIYNWQERYGQVNEHNGWILRDHWLEDREKRAIIDYYGKHPLEGYCRLTYMMLDANVVAVSAASVYRVLKGAGLLARCRSKPSRKGKGFHQPSRPHLHWHVDIAYVNIRRRFYFMTSILDGYSRYIVH